MLPALAGATAAKVLVCFFVVCYLLNSPLGGREKCHKNAKSNFFSSEPGLFAGQCISSTHLLDMAEDYAKKKYLSSNFTMAMFGTRTKALFTDYV